MPADQGLAQADVLDELRDVGRPVGQAPDDAQAVDVGEGLVEAADRTQVVGLVDNRREGRADAGGGRTQGKAPVINDALYQAALMLCRDATSVKVCRVFILTGPARSDYGRVPPWIGVRVG